jgi:FkbM family methyltransferase
MRPWKLGNLDFKNTEWTRRERPIQSHLLNATFESANYSESPREPQHQRREMNTGCYLTSRKLVVRAIGIVLLLILLLSGAISNSSMISASTTTVGNNADILSVASTQHTLTREALREMFEHVIKKEVRFNHWGLGCSDLTILAPYFRAISDKYFYIEGNENTRLIFDVGANNGDDAESVLGAFHKIVGMCSSYAVPFKLISVEPSPQVFCELDDLAREKKWKSPAQNMLRLNIALSDKTGYLAFRDPGHEGGGLVNGTDKELGPMTADFLQNVTKCGISKEIKHTIDDSRITIVPTFTMDLLVSSLEDLNIVGRDDNIFVLKIDTEGHDVHVLMGAKQLLEEKRITFVVFETYTNLLTKQVTELMGANGYLCFIISQAILLPIHTEDWWYDHLEKPLSWWGNGVCGIRGSRSLGMLWRMFHSGNISLVNAYELL